MNPPLGIGVVERKVNDKNYKLCKRLRNQGRISVVLVTLVFLVAR